MTNALPVACGDDRVLVVFDYDWSLINEDSDKFIFKELYPELLDEMLAYSGPHPTWTQFVDDLLRRLVLDKPHVNEKLIRQTLASVPIQPRMLDAIKLAGAQPNAVVMIVSGGNTVYIESMLDHHGLTPLVREVVANPAAFEQDERLRVRPYHDSETPHGCPLCPPNMCKGLILDRIRREHACSRILYVGDGTGDYCPVKRMTRHDKVLARDEDARDEEFGGLSFGLLKKIRKDSASVEAAVVPWRTGEDIFNAFAAEFGSEYCSRTGM